MSRSRRKKKAVPLAPGGPPSEKLTTPSIPRAPTSGKRIIATYAVLLAAVIAAALAATYLIRGM